MCGKLGLNKTCWLLYTSNIYIYIYIKIINHSSPAQCISLFHQIIFLISLLACLSHQIIYIYIYLLFLFWSELLRVQLLKQSTLLEQLVLLDQGLSWSIYSTVIQSELLCAIQVHFFSNLKKKKRKKKKRVTLPPHVHYPCAQLYNSSCHRYDTFFFIFY